VIDDGASLDIPGRLVPPEWLTGSSDQASLYGPELASVLSTVVEAQRCTDLDARCARLHNRCELRSFWRTHMQEWHKPEVTEQEVGLEVTSYLPAEV
jgi:coenzyme PQQ precursor peptide PqqA